MPPVGPQGSRGGLITAVVVFTIGFVTSTIFAIYYGVALNKSELDKKNLTDQARIYFSASTNPHIEQLKAARNNPSSTLKDRTILGASLQETVDEANIISGNASPAHPTDVIKQAAAALDQVGKTTGKAPTNLLDAISALISVNEAAQRDAELQRAEAVKAVEESKHQIALAQTAVTKMQEEVAAANKIKNDYLNGLLNTGNKYQIQSVKDAQASELILQNANKQIKIVMSQKDTLDKSIADLNKQIDTYKRRLENTRFHTEEVVARQSDGQILSVAGENIVYINLGKQDHIVPGMTFEVYSKQDGVPKLGDGLSNDQLPIGLGSIEVQLVFSDSAQCRVTKLEIGQHFQQGDLIANLVYDRNTKYNFYVYGRFDLGQLGAPSDADRDKIVGLVQNWGGKIMNKINIDTDFVVMGSEPKVDTYTADQLNDPFYVRQKDDQEKAVKAYNDIRDQAVRLSIPIMNQNRFLYLCGYYDVAQR
ncbi:MAG: hypothetical protein M3O30_13380 [Planctomycetota bacterium]|nr:hypothetical protein [Planctomycetota bacterium]